MRNPKKHAQFKPTFLLNDPATEMPWLLQLINSEEGAIGDPVQETLVNRYFDTQEWDLYNAGWSYCIRDISPEKGSVSLAPLPGLVHQPGPEPHEGTDLEIDGVDRLPASSAQPIAEVPFSDALRGIIENRGEGLSELFRVSTERATYRLALDGAEVLLRVDDISVESDERISTPHPKHFCEIELELVSGKEKRLRRLAGKIQKKLNVSVSRMSRFERALQGAGCLPLIVLSADPNDDPNDGMGAVSEATRATTEAIARAFFQFHFRSLLSAEALVRDSSDPRGVHKMRVASRRLHVGLRVFGDCLPARASKALRSELRWIRKKLGIVRDLDVFSDLLTADVADLESEMPVFQAHVAAAWAMARSDLVKALTSARFLRFRRDFAAFLNGECWGDSMGCEPNSVQFAEDVLLPALTRVRKGGAGINHTSPEILLHRLRLDCKEFRYRLEIFTPLVPGGLKSWIKACKSLQNYIGVRRDVFVALGCVEEFRKANELSAAEREELKKLRKLLKARLRDLRERHYEKWSDFSSSVRRKKLRKLLRESEAPTASDPMEAPNDEAAPVPREQENQLPDLRPLTDYVIS